LIFHYSSRLLHSIETRIQEVKIDTGEISRVVHHTADVVNTLPEMSERVIDMHTMMRNMKVLGFLLLKLL
jgi:hypothetical protein